MINKYKNNNIHIKMSDIDNSIFSEYWHDDKIGYFADFVFETDLYILEIDYYGFIRMYNANNGYIYIMTNDEFNQFFTGKKIILTPVPVSDYDQELLKDNGFID